MKELLTTKVISVMFILCALSVFAGTAQADTLFSDGFESGDFTAGGWIKTSVWPLVDTASAHTGTYGAGLYMTTSGIAKAQSTVGYSTIHVKYWRKTTAGASTETFYCDWSADGGTTWTNLDTRTGTTSWTYMDKTCPAGADNNADFRVRFRNSSSGGSTSDVARVDDVEITGTAPQYTISGTVTCDETGLDGVTMSGLTGNPVTSGGGLYSATVSSGWSGTVTPTKAGYTFTPADRTYTSVAEDHIGDNYAATLNTYTISGYIENECNEPIEGVLVDANNGGGEDTTDVNGFYEVGVDYNWSGTVTPSKAHYTFEPNLMSYVAVLADQPDQNYAAHNIYDLDYDCCIGWGDVAVIHDNWLQTGEDIPGDFSGDDTVNFLDFADFALVWQAGE